MILHEENPLTMMNNTLNPANLTLNQREGILIFESRTLQSIGCTRYSSLGYGLHSVHSSISGWNNSGRVGCFSAIKTISLPRHAVFITGV